MKARLLPYCSLTGIRSLQRRREFSLYRSRIRPSGPGEVRCIRRSWRAHPTGSGRPGLQVGKATITCSSECGSTRLLHDKPSLSPGRQPLREPIHLGLRARLHKTCATLQPLYSRCFPSISPVGWSCVNHYMREMGSSYHVCRCIRISMTEPLSPFPPVPSPC